MSTANGREAAEEDVQLIGGHLTSKISAEYLCDHAEEHHTTRTEAVPEEERELRVNRCFYEVHSVVYLLFEQMMSQNASGQHAEKMEELSYGD